MRANIHLPPEARSLGSDLPAAGAGQPKWLLVLCFSRFAASLAFMIYPGALAAVIPAWGMTASEAGLIQTIFNISYAASLVLTGWVSDQVGAKRVFLWSSALTAVMGVAVALFARSFTSGLLLFSALGLVHGGTYTPSIMLVAEGVPRPQRGAAMGLLLAAASLGYVGSIAITNASVQLSTYEAGFVVCGVAPAIGAIAAWLATRSRPNLFTRRSTLTVVASRRPPWRHRSGLLTMGYTAHCWELLGMWAWMPAFLTAALATLPGGTTGLQGLWIGTTIHLSGCLSAFTMGRASDKLGYRPVLIWLAVSGALCSFSIGWLGAAPSGVLLALAAVYGFTALGDSPVLSTAMTDWVPAGSLGSALAVRSILGFGAGGLAPVAFGYIRDLTPATSSWGVAFAVLGIGGVLAAVCAVLLPKERPADRPPETPDPSDLNHRVRAKRCPEG